jgi:hypothetical protein
MNVCLPMELMSFQTVGTTTPFSRFAIQVMHSTEEGRRRYLSTVVINRPGR